MSIRANKTGKSTPGFDPGQPVCPPLGGAVATVEETPAPPGAQGDAPHVVVFIDRCAGCQECVVRCPTGALYMDPDRWVAAANDELCVGCRQCVRTCPFAAIAVEGPLAVAPRTEFRAYHPAQLEGDTKETRPTFASWEEAVAEAERCLLCPDPTCMRGCPAHNDIPAFIHGLRSGDLELAHQSLRATSVLPDVCARVCDHSAQCEGACTWTLAGGKAVAIGAIERFICDNAPVPSVEVSSDVGRGMSVAVVGSGPAGVAAAWELVEASASVTMYEKDAEPLGVLRWGIPDFTLPQRVIERPWNELAAAGVDVRLSSQVFPEDIDTLLENYDAVMLCQGASRSRGLPVPGGDLGGVEEATDFLERGKTALAEGGRLAELEPITSADGSVIRRKVFVLGAGDTAMDVCRTARRFGAEVVCLNRRDRAHARVRPDELAEAEAEGVVMQFSTTIASLEGNEDGRLAAAYLAPTRQRRGNAPPEVLTSKAERHAVDLVVSATGYVVDPGFVSAVPGTAKRREAPMIAERRWTGSGIAFVGAPDARKPTGARDIERSPIGRSSLDREVDLAAAQLPFKSRVWVAGDALTGPATVVEAMAQGREAARAVLLERPSRTGRAEFGGPRRVLVAYESETGNTKRAGTTLAGIMGAAGAEVRAMHLRDVGISSLAWADLIIVGTWVEGFVVAAVRPAKGARAFLDRLPHLAGKKVALYCTYAVSPGKALSMMRSGFEAQGATVVGEHAICQRALNREPEAFGAELITKLWPSVRGDDVASKARTLIETEASDPVQALVWHVGGRPACLEAGRLVLERMLAVRSDDFIASKAIELIRKASAVAKERPVVKPGSWYRPGEAGSEPPPHAVAV